MRLRAFVDQPLTVPDPLFGPARRIADQVVGVLCSRVWNMGLAMRGYKVPYPEDTDEAVSEMGTPLPDAKGQPLFCFVFADPVFIVSSRICAP